MISKLFKHTLSVICLAQIFSTVGFAVLYSSLSLYMTNVFGYDSTNAYAIVAVFLAYNYGLHLLGSYLGGLLSSYRALFLVSMIFQVISCFVLAVPTISALYIGLTLFLVATGINMPCLNMMITQRYQTEHVKRERAFLWSYSAANIGFFLGYTVAGYFELSQAYTSLFLVASIFNILALVTMIYGWKAVKDQDTPLIRAIKTKGRQILTKRYLLTYRNFNFFGERFRLLKF